MQQFDDSLTEAETKKKKNNTVTTLVDNTARTRLVQLLSPDLQSGHGIRKIHPGSPLSARNGSNPRWFSNGLIRTCGVRLAGSVIWMTFFYLDRFTGTDFIKSHEYMYGYIFAKRTSEVLASTKMNFFWGISWAGRAVSQTLSILHILKRTFPRHSSTKFRWWLPGTVSKPPKSRIHYSPLGRHTEGTIKKRWYVLDTDPTLKGEFNSLPRVVFKRPPHLRHTPLRSDLPP